MFTNSGEFDSNFHLSLLNYNYYSFKSLRIRFSFVRKLVFIAHHLTISRLPLFPWHSLLSIDLSIYERKESWRPRLFDPLCFLRNALVRPKFKGRMSAWGYALPWESPQTRESQPPENRRPRGHRIRPNRGGEDLLTGRTGTRLTRTGSTVCLQHAWFISTKNR